MSTIIGVAGLLLLGVVVFRHAQRPNPTNTSRLVMRRLGLNVEHQGPVLLLAWNRSSQPMHHASHAILYIKDGPTRSQLDLNRQQLGAANVKYWPETPKVTFTLQVYEGDGSISESVQIAGNAGEAAAQPKRGSVALASNPSMETDRPSPFAQRTQREIRPETSIGLATPLQPRLIATAAATPPPVVSETPDQRSRLGRMVGRIPLLRRLTKHPQQPDDDYPPK